MGIGQSSSSLARRAGHAGSGTLDGQFGGAPSYFGGAAMLGAFLAASGLQRLIAAEQSAPKAQC